MIVLMESGEPSPNTARIPHAPMIGIICAARNSSVPSTTASTMNHFRGFTSFSILRRTVILFCDISALLSEVFKLLLGIPKIPVY